DRSRRLPGMSALALLVAKVVADDHDATVPADHLAVVADLLDAGLDLHACSSFIVARPPVPPWSRRFGRRRRSWVDGLLVAVDDAAAAEVVRAELDHHPVLGEDPDVVLAHLARDVSEDDVPVAQLYSEHRVRE